LRCSASRAWHWLKRNGMNGANVEQAIRVIVLYIDQRPARMHEEFLHLALEALRIPAAGRGP
jgi:hypothetical protein